MVLSRSSITDGRSADLAVTDRRSGTVIGEAGLSGLDPRRHAARVTNAPTEAAKNLIKRVKRAAFG